MCIVEMDASQWRTPMEFVAALRTAVGAPQGHGDTVDAFVDSMIWGGLNRIEAPYEVRVAGCAQAAKEVQEEIVFFSQVLAEGRTLKHMAEGQDTEVCLTIAN